MSCAGCKVFNGTCDCSQNFFFNNSVGWLPIMMVFTILFIFVLIVYLKLKAQEEKCQSLKN